LLILGRRINQSIVFPNCGITVRILDINGRVAKIGIEAPRSVEIMRGELVAASQSQGTYGSHGDNAHFPADYDAGSEQPGVPEEHSPVLQFAQRLAEIRAGLHLFQQRRAAGDELGADQVFGDLLDELGNLDADSLKSLSASTALYSPESTEFVSETRLEYETGRLAKPFQILVVNEQGNPKGLTLPVGTFHGCQMCTVNNRETALRAIASSEPFDFIVCNGSPMPFDELELVRTIRSDRRLENTRVFMTSVSESAMEHLELSFSYGIDGWLARPLLSHDLWKHIVESQKFES